MIAIYVIVSLVSLTIGFVAGACIAGGLAMTLMEQPDIDSCADYAHSRVTYIEEAKEV